MPPPRLAGCNTAATTWCRSGQALAAEFGDRLAALNHGIADPALWQDTVRDFAIAAMLASIREDLAALGVQFDRFSSERELLGSGAPDQVIARLQADGLLYAGTLEPPKGKLPDDWEPREQTLFRSTAFGDDVDPPAAQVRRLATPISPTTSPTTPTRPSAQTC